MLGAFDGHIARVFGRMPCDAGLPAIVTGYARDVLK